MAGLWDNDKAVERLKEMIALGYSAGQIAKVLSKEFIAVSRCAVIGKASRMGLLLGDPKRALEIRTVHTRRHVAAGQANSPAPVAPLPASLTDPVRQGRVDALALSPKTLADPAFGGCRWPLYAAAPDGQALFCCNARDEGRTYCAAHACLAFTKTQPAEAKASEAARTAENRKAGVGKTPSMTFSPRAA